MSTSLPVITPMPSQSLTPTLETEVVKLPLYKSLLYSVRLPGALTADAVDEKNIPLENNPHFLHTFMNDSVEYWVDGSGSLLHMKFPARLNLNGQYSHIGPYFNMPHWVIITLKRLWTNSPEPWIP
ncbi:hypothetical protein BDR07DRAFT_1383929 [Suillus spraguei]|nr:hypothetical protein BDR07DRAFT_1383929 [Suillus spraguei]